MAASRTTKKKTTNTKTTRKKKQSSSGGFQNEIILLVILAASVILLVSNFGMGGIVGNAISQAAFGLMGLMAYVFPIILFIGAAFLLSNKTNPLAYKKTIAAVVLVLVMCGLLQLVTEGYVDSNTLMDYYHMSADYQTGGGLIGGAICISTISAFGTVGAYVIIVMVILVCLILITQRSFFGFLNRILDWFVSLAKGSRQRYEEGRPERELKKELKTQQRQKAAEERRAERLRRLEEALAEEEAEELSEQKPSPAKKNGKKASRKQSAGKSPVEKQPTHFLEGTELFPVGGGTPVSGAEESSAAREENGFQPSQAEVPQFLHEIPEAVGDTLTIDTRDSEQETQMEFAIHREEPAAPVREERMSGAHSVQPEDYPEQYPEESPEALAEAENAKTACPNPKSSKEEIAGGIVNIQHEINQQEAAAKKEYRFPRLSS